MKNTEVIYPNKGGVKIGIFKKYLQRKAQAVSGIYFMGGSSTLGFSGDIYDHDLVRLCIHSNAMHTGKASAKSLKTTEAGIKADELNKRLQRLLNESPNPYCTGYSFLYRIRTIWEVKGQVFIYIDKNYKGDVMGFYPIYYSSVEALVDDRGDIKGYRFMVNNHEYIFPYEDVAVLIKNTYRHDYFGEGNSPLNDSLDMLSTIDSGVKKAVELTTSLRGIVKSTKTMLKDEDIDKFRKRFVNDYVNLSNTSGIAALDGTMDFIPLNLDPKTANAVQMGMYEKRVMQYFGQNEKILSNDYTESIWTAYYEGAIEPFLIALSQELTKKVFSVRERGFSNTIIYESNRLQHVATNTKLQLVALVDRGLLTTNEYREILNLAPVEGGDKRVIRKEYMEVNDL